jgi:hypothetical protein
MTERSQAYMDKMNALDKRAREMGTVQREECPWHQSKSLIKTMTEAAARGEKLNANCPMCEGYDLFCKINPVNLNLEGAI